jgi:hypothetical protein
MEVQQSLITMVYRMLTILAAVILVQLCLVFTMPTGLSKLGTVLLLVVIAINALFTLKTVRTLLGLLDLLRAVSSLLTKSGQDNPTMIGGKVS